MMEMRMRTKRSDEYLAGIAGYPVLPEDVVVKLAGPAKVFASDGRLLCVYLPQAAREVCDAMQEDFSSIRGMTGNRGMAAGTEREWRGKRQYTAPIASSILGSFDPAGRMQYCRLTAFTAKEGEKWNRLRPFFTRIGDLFQENVPDRFENQIAKVRETQPEWVIEGTPFTTITVNNTYPTGIHTDKGDLDDGFSTLAVMRRGAFSGGWLTFPRYGIAADMQQGDVILMDAHEWHGNTPILCNYCGEALRKFDHRCPTMPADAVSPERVSVVSYYRTKMANCDTAEEEDRKRAEFREKEARAGLGWDDNDDGIEQSDLVTKLEPSAP